MELGISTLAKVPRPRRKNACCDCHRLCTGDFVHGSTKTKIDEDEMAVAGGLIGAPVRTIRCKTVDLEVPADAEIVIEGEIATDYLNLKDRLARVAGM